MKRGKHFPLSRAEERFTQPLTIAIAEADSPFPSAISPFSDQAFAFAATFATPGNWLLLGLRRWCAGRDGLWRCPDR